MEPTENQKNRSADSVAKAKAFLKKGDRVRVTKCPGTPRTITFDRWDGPWMVSKSGIDDYHPSNVTKVNGKHKSF
jgi:hypothetical protein